MSETVEVPVLGLGREQTQMWTQAFLAASRLWRERRQNLGRLAWSDSLDASRRAEVLAELADPPVRTMTVDEASQFRSSLHGDPPNPAQQTRDVTVDSGAARVTVAPMPGPGTDEAWGLVADGRRTSGEQVEPVLVRCRTELAAKKLADDILRRGPGSVERLGDFAELAAQRAATAGDEVVEPEAQRLARTAAAIREAWSDYGDLPERIITATAAHQAAGHEWNPAFGPLAWRLHQLEERGYAMSDVLARVGASRLQQGDIRNPAAFAEWIVEELVDNLPLVNLDDLDGPSYWVDDLGEVDDLADREGRRHSTASGPEWGRSADPGRRVTAAGSVAAEQNHSRAVAAEAAVGPLLRDALPADALERVQQARRYPQLRDELFAAHSAGRPVGQLLADLPVARIAGAHDPAAYLASVLQRREQQRSAPPRRLVDKVGMAGLVEQGCPRDLADKIVGSRSWPGLAKRLASWRSDGLPVTDMLAALNHRYIDTSRDPAAYTITLMNAKASAFHRDRPEQAHTSVSRGDGHSTAPSTGRDTSRAQGGSGATGARDPQEVIDIGWTDELDERSAVDEVGLHAARGLGSPADDARLEERLRRVTTTQGPAPGDPSAADAAAADAAADAARACALHHEADAAPHRSTPDLEGTPAREDLEGQDHTRVDEQLAAGERAAAAEDREDAAAAATRAEVTFTAPTAPSRGGPARSGPTAAPSRSPRPTRGRAPTREPGRAR